MDKSKFIEFIFVAFLALFVLLFIYPVIYFILWNWPLEITSIICIILTLVLILAYKQGYDLLTNIDSNSKLHCLNKLYTFSFVLSILIMSSVLTIVIIETNYYSTYCEFEDDYLTMRNVGYSDIDAIFNATKEYLDKENFDSTWTDENGTIPRRVVTGKQLYFLFNLPTSVYLFHYDGLDKFTAYSKTGNCEEKAVSLSILINDATKYPTRQISMVGFDHGFTEAKIDEDWYVYDTGFTTYQFPVLAKNYSSYLDSSSIASVNRNVVDLLCIDSGKSCMEEHGFKMTKLSINFVDRFDKPVENPNIEIYGINENSGNQLLKSGIAENGNYSCNLRSGLEYCLVAKRVEAGKQKAILKIFETEESELVLSFVI